ncbi:hypothetical protein UFOVP45_108 [uncultured Caudovirales phage]|uniref:Uncharacterized protein n=1 Tax=uncultured Caudovirales phage TaxID=2100421 RepID=A0A6J5KSK2_9CAUD|nr:hypothetical protein UFOVP45_108 [uncultured Caudovirales phage]
MFGFLKRNKKQDIVEQSIEAVKVGANPEWLAEALDAVERLAGIHAEFTTDAVWAVLKTSTPEKRAMGAVMRTATHRGIIAPTESFTPSLRIASHRRPLRVWKSLVKN